MKSLMFAVLVALAGCSSSPDPSCVVLQDYYDDCCATCGAADSYCSDIYYVEEDGEASCASEIIEEGDLSVCACD